MTNLADHLMNIRCYLINVQADMINTIGKSILGVGHFKSIKSCRFIFSDDGFAIQLSCFRMTVHSYYVESY